MGMKRSLKILSIAFCGLCMAFPMYSNVKVHCDSSKQINLRFKDGEFKIVQFTDLHWISGKSYERTNDSTIALMESVIGREHPDLVIITGDVVVSSGAEKGWDEVTKPMIDAKVPFAITFGNHDPESDMTKEQVLKKLQSMPYNVTYNADNKISGVGNCTLPVMSSDGNNYKWILYLFDSHDYPKNKMFGYYDWIKNDQIQWYRNMRDFYISKAGKVLPSVAFFHIPLPEYAQGLSITSAIGNKEDDVCSPNVNSGLCSSFVEKRDVIGVFTGHDHNSDYLIDLNGELSLAYGRKTGYNAAYHEVLERGARVITLYENEHNFSTYITTLSGKKEYCYTFEQKAHPYPTVEGTFIQDWLTESWDDCRWQKELTSLKKIGINYLILAPSVSVDKNGRIRYIYPSLYSKRNERSPKDVIDICLRNAKRVGMKVFLGLNMDDKWWSANFSEDWLYKQMEIGNKIADELVSKYKNKYGDTMYGWYWPWEVDNVHAVSAEYQTILEKAININLDHLNKITPDMSFMMSPFANSKLGTADDNCKMWSSILPKVHFKDGDIFAPQDGVGAGGVNVDQLPTWFEKMRQAVNTKPGLKFWANVESFDARFWTSAPLSRYIDQLDNVNTYVNKIITFAYPHYYSPYQVNKQYNDVYSQYCISGVLPRISVPAPISDLKILKKDNCNVLEWKSPENKKNLAGYYVYKDGVLIGSIQKRIDNANLEFMDKANSSGSCLYEVSSYNVNGNESEKIKIR
jgi:hypothetical protein